MARPTAMDDLFVHQIPELLPNVVTRHPHWRESVFFELHAPTADGDVLFFTMAHFPSREVMDAIQLGRIGGEGVMGYLNRTYDGDPHTIEVDGARTEIVTPFEEIKLWADPALAGFGLDATFHARTEPYGLRRGTMRAGNEIIWDQCHILQSGTYSGSYTTKAGETHSVDGWIGQRDHSWGIRDHGRCPLWMWLQLQFEDGFLGVWHWELANGARVYTDGCWAGTDRSEPIPLVDFHHELEWVGGDYGEHGEAVTGLRGHCEFVLEDGRRIGVDAEGTFDRPYEPFHRGGLSQMRFTTDDGREGTAIYEVTGARHHRYFPATALPDGALPR